ncbi:MAG: hypothetical protein WCT01_03575 [Candidatus Shapirobacteria bacterium]
MSKLLQELKFSIPASNMTAYSLLIALISFIFRPIPSLAQGLIGTINNPNPQYPSTGGTGLFVFMSNLFKLAGTIGGLILVFQLVTAGFGYLTAEGDAKKTAMAFTKIWQSLLGLIIIASAFIIAGVAERLTGIKIINPVIYGP